MNICSGVLFCRLARTCTEDCEINGVPFRKGWMVRIMLCTVYSDDSFFPKADEFDANRCVCLCVYLSLSLSVPLFLSLSLSFFSPTLC